MISRAFIRALTILFSLTTIAAFGQTHSNATKIGPAKGITDIGCNGGFIDVKGACWKCPSGIKHDNIFLPPTDRKVCKDEGGRENITGTEHGKATGVLGTDCPKGQWRSSHNGKCYSCPNNFSHDIAKMGNVRGVCWRDKKDAYAAATRMAGNAFCDKDAYPDPIGGGTCWTCPKEAPTRNFTERVDSARACVSANCGNDGGRPCLVTERVPSCDAALVEDIVKNKCVTEQVAFQTCKATVNSLKAGKVPPQFQGLFGELKRKSKLVTPAELERHKKQAISFVDANRNAVPEVRRLCELMQSQKDKVDAIFDADTLCSPAKLKQMVLGPAKALVTPNYKGNFFLAHTIVVAGAWEVGAQAGLTLAMDFGMKAGLPTIRAVGIYGWVGPQLVTNATIGISRGIQFYPVTTLDGFKWLLG